MLQTTINANNLDPRKPETYPRRVLLAVCGLSPQIVTETLYALSQVQLPGWVPTEVHLLTTSEGAHKAKLSLLSHEPGWFHRLCKDYPLSGIDFGMQNIHVLLNAQGLPMDDIRTIEDNGSAADAITAKVREITADPNCSLHVSIAGGRKSMGFYVGYALSLFGRSQDRLSHVLVSEPYENTIEFFYPTPYSRVLQLRDGRYVDTKDAVVSLASIPFVSIRHGMPQELLGGHVTFQETVRQAQFALKPPELIIHRREKYIIASGVKIWLSSVNLALLCVFARRVVQGLPPVAAPHKEVPDPEWKAWFEAEYRFINNLQNDNDHTLDSMKHGMTGNNFSTMKTRTADALKRALGPAAKHYTIFDGGVTPRRYSLTLPVSAVQFIS